MTVQSEQITYDILQMKKFNGVITYLKYKPNFGSMAQPREKELQFDPRKGRYLFEGELLSGKEQTQIEKILANHKSTNQVLQDALIYLHKLGFARRFVNV